MVSSCSAMTMVCTFLPFVSCRYGDQCKFLHVNQQQPRPGASPFQVTQQQQQQKPNPFGFGTGSKSRFSNTNQQQQQQQKPNPFGFGTGSKSRFSDTNEQQQSPPNPFGFGVQNASPSKGASAFGGKHLSNSQPFDNKWVRSTSSTQSNKTSAQPQHNCTEPESCKRLIVEDFNDEKPLWKLTCYAHFKCLPCDIVGDISYEELRFAAYEDARRGLPLESIIQRERNLLSSKLVEFENLLRNPYLRAQSTNTASMNLFPAVSSSPPFSSAQTNAPLNAFSFGQSPPASNFGSNISNVFGQSTTFQAPQEARNGFGTKDQNSGPFGGQLPKPFGVSPGADFPNLKNNTVTMQISPFSAFSSSLAAQTDVIATNQTSVAPTESKVDDNLKDNSIWLKTTWEIKEIPEEEPPPRFCV